ncbi:tRNA cyclic N6-threonylcarbamoyladenosine(37) synthase TcdA [Gayadomonas joobiniege]|uniref:tRNA cyclic N6-threonylcarbamoyladenosine(37) synthase TcdA n=1 Tax=Gayadomonas joobiniege TaxID=1234606 RepID=UPI00036817E4|nr:tRNA cyclic N6-threonylcarbamoyladenosine(37) synthase TcdA [Gayadomonas joobiniege]
MRADNFSNKFGGTARLYGEPGLKTLAESHVAVVGLGGVGSWAAEALARSAIGKISLFDLDDICVSNTNRQIHAVSGSYGQSKCAAMATRIQLINADCQIFAIEDFVTAETVREYITTEFDYVIDATDSVACKAAMIAHCKRNKIKMVTVGGAGGQLDPSQIQIGDLAKTIQDPLLAKVRNTLRREYGFSRNPKRKFSIDAVYSLEQLKYPTNDGGTCLAKPEMQGGSGLDCATGFGAGVVVTGTFGFFAASLAIKRLTQHI